MSPLIGCCRHFFSTIAVAATMLVSSGPSRSAAEFEIISDQKSTATGAELCLAVDTAKPLAPAPGAQIPPALPATKPLPLMGTFLPIVAVRCDARAPLSPARWTFSDTLELRTTVNSMPMCLSARLLRSFEPLLEPFLNAFHATDQGSPYAYLKTDFMPGGTIDAGKLRNIPDLVASACGRTDATDFWKYDGPTQTISSPTGMGHLRTCIIVHGNRQVRPPIYDAGMPVGLAPCPDLQAFAAAPRAEQRWRLSAGQDALPNYAPPTPGNYFNGSRGLPIVGPMGRCLTVALPEKTAVTSDCDGRVEQDWRFNGGAIEAGTKAECLARAADGVVGLGACTNGDNQKWSYVVRDQTPNPKWRNADVFGQIHPNDNAGQCLIVARDPFIDPVRQNNPVKVAPCSSVQPRQTSWFRTQTVHTVRMALIPNSNDDGSEVALGGMTDDAAKRTIEDLAFHLSETYHVLGVRFVFDPEHDYQRVRDTIANRQLYGAQNDKPSDWDPENHNMRVASSVLYGKATIVTAANFRGGGFSSASYMDFDLAKALDPITQAASYNKPHLAAGIPKDKAGLLAFSYYVGEAGIGVGIGNVSHHAHEFGHYLGLLHTFNPDEFADTPDDIASSDLYLNLGSLSCGNARTVTSHKKTVTPDRNNNQGYFGCAVGRAHNSFSPMQLGKASWVLQNQLNRYPLVACQPIRNYDADRLECENAESLALCQQTAEYLRSKTGSILDCRPGGRFTRALAAALQSPAVTYLLFDTPAGRSLMNKLARLPVRDAPLPAATQEALVAELKANNNLAVTMALINRFGELKTLVAPRSPTLAKAGFTSHPEKLAPADQAIVASLAGQVITPGFISGVPAILSR